MTRESQVLKGRQVLIVEDQFLVADQMSRSVRALGGEVVGPAAHARAALELLATKKVDLAILDVNLGDGDVYPVAVELNHRQIAFMFATGYERWVIPEEFRDVPHLEKPVTSRALEEAVGSVKIGD